MIDQDQQLDEVAPSAPLTAYRAYAKAFSSGDGASGLRAFNRTRPLTHHRGAPAESRRRVMRRGCAISGARLLRTLPPADVVGGEAQSPEASLYIAPVRRRADRWIFRIVVMKREGEQVAVRLLARSGQGAGCRGAAQSGHLIAQAITFNAAGSAVNTISSNSPM